MANAFDEFTQNTTNAFDEYTPSTTSSTTMPSATEVLQTPKSWWQSVNSPTQPEEFSGKDVLSSAAINAGINLGLEGPAGVIPGAISGATSGVAGEYARSIGASPMTQTVAELLGGGGPSLVYKFAKTGINPLVTRVLNKNVDLNSISNEARETAKNEVMTKLFGADNLNTNFDRTLFLEGQTKLAKDLGIPLDVVGEGNKVSTILRGKLYDDVQKLSEQTSTSTIKTPGIFDIFGMQKVAPRTQQITSSNIFFNSPEFKSLLSDIDVLKNRGTQFASDAQITNLKKTLTLPLKGPGEQAAAKKDLLNLIQNGGAKFSPATKETTEAISEDMQKALRERFNQYLERNLGSEQYNILKQAEAEEFTALGRDAIKHLTSSPGTLRSGNPDFEFVVKAIKNSPEGKKDLAIAVMQQISKETDEKAIIKELNNFRAAILNSKTLPREEVDSIYSGIRKVLDEAKAPLARGKGVDAAIKSQERLNKVKQIVLLPLSGAISAEVANYGGSYTRNQPTKTPLDVFTF